MEIMRSSSAAIDGLADYPTERRWIEIPAGDGQHLRVHLVDTGPTDAPVVVFLHGNPSWSYIWRHQIPAVVAAGYRAIAPELVGMGMSGQALLARRLLGRATRRTDARDGSGFHGPIDSDAIVER